MAQGRLGDMSGYKLAQLVTKLDAEGMTYDMAQQILDHPGIAKRWVRAFPRPNPLATIFTAVHDIPPIRTRHDGVMPISDVLHSSLEILAAGGKVRFPLQKAGFSKVGQVMMLTEAAVKRLPDMGGKNTAQLIQSLAHIGLRLLEPIDLRADEWVVINQEMLFPRGMAIDLPVKVWSHLMLMTRPLDQMFPLAATVRDVMALTGDQLTDLFCLKGLAGAAGTMSVESARVSALQVESCLVDCGLTLKRPVR